MKKKNTSFYINKIWINVLLWILVIVVIYPLFWIFINSLKTNQNLFINTFNIPTDPLFSNYVEAWNMGLSGYFLNSIIVGSISILATVTIGAFCAYGLSRVKSKWKMMIYYLIIGGLLLSPQSALISLYRILEFFNIYNTYLAMILPYIAFRLPFAIFLMYTYFKDFPKELEDSALIDGCTTFTTFTKIVIPISKPILSTVSIMTAIFVWNEFLFAMVFLEDSKLYTIPIGLYNFKDALSTNWTVLLAGIIIATVPIIILFLFMSKSFIRGLTEGSVKG